MDATRRLIDRRLRALVDDGGRFRVLALDHRRSLTVEIDPARPDDVDRATVVELKRAVVAAVCRADGERPTAVMLDPEYAVPELLDDGTVPGTVGVICALEAQSYHADPDRPAEWLGGWTPARIAATGAAAAKLLILHRPDGGSRARAQEAMVARTVEACLDEGLPLVVEPVPYDVVDAADRRACVVGSAEILAALDRDRCLVLKSPFPGAPGDEARSWATACRDLDRAAGAVPWATLSWGAPFDEFARQLAVACAHGCSGFIAGRAIWRPALDAADREAALATEVVPAYQTLHRLADEARPIFELREVP